MDNGFSEGILNGGVVGSVVSAIDPIAHAEFTFRTAGKEVLRITSKGELIFAEASEAAEALLREWNRLRGE